MRGDISTPWAQRAKEYSWHKCVSLAPRNITPTDIDFAVECAGRFMLFEFKTTGTEMGYGQRLFFERLLSRLGLGHFLMICEHPPLEKISLADDITRVWLWAHDGTGTWVSDPLPGDAFVILYEAFFKEAEGEIHAMRVAYREILGGVT